MAKRFFTSESVTEGHPDKLCDRISDAILDALLEKDPMSRVGCETTATTGVVYVMGEITTAGWVDIPKVVRETIKSVGYDGPLFGFDGSTCAVITSIDEQSLDIAMGVNSALEIKRGDEEEANVIGAGDQGMMFGYACDETPELMPLAISLAHKLAKRLAQVRKSGLIPYLGPDGKTQVTVEYDGDVPKRVDTVVISTQHTAETNMETLKKDIVDEVIKKVVAREHLDENTKILINPTGRFVVGGPTGDSGLTGRKIIVDTYGGAARHGGGAFSGKDPTKVDRSAAYAARYIAKNLVAAGICKKCEIQIAYAIGVANPLSINVDTHGTGLMDEEKIGEIVNKHFDLRPASIIKKFDLRRPIYTQLAAYGHMGREDLDVPWEKTDMAATIRKEVNL